MFWNRQPEKPTAAQHLSRCMQQAACEFEDEKEQLEVFQITFRGLVSYASECESSARLRGSSSSQAFRAIGHAMQAVSAGTDKVIAALPPPSPAALKAMREMLGIKADEREPADAEV